MRLMMMMMMMMTMKVMQGLLHGGLTGLYEGRFLVRHTCISRISPG